MAKTGGMRTVGVEEELLLVDASTGVPAAVATSIVPPGTGPVRPDSPRTPDPGSIDAELQQQQIEIDTPPVTDLTELAPLLRRWRRTADDLARPHAARIAAIGTSPLPVTAEITVTSRYRAMAEHFGLTTTEQLTCGCHVHVAIDSPEEGVAVLNRIRVWLPALLALSANSPFWQGHDSGYASYRSQSWNRFPGAGPTRVFDSVDQYRSFTDTLVGTEVLLDHAMVYFDARLSPRYPTVEIRVADVCLNADDTVLIAALARALVETASREWQLGVSPPDVPTEFLRLASWLASRSALDAHLLDPLTARPRPAGEAIAALLDHARPALIDAGDLELVGDSWARLRTRGGGASIQRGRAAEAGLAAAVLTAADLTLA